MLRRLQTLSILCMLGLPDSAWAQCSPGDLSAQLDALIDDGRLKGTQISGMVVHADSGESLWSREPDLPLNPASTQKLLTLLAVLDALGPSYKIKTTIEAHGTVTDGVLEGDLYIRGGGDPTLEFPRWRKLIEDSYVAGIHRVTGNLVIDNSLLEPQKIPGWSGGNESFTGSLYEAPISALNIHYNSLGLLISPGATVDAPVDARLEIPTSAAIIDNQAMTKARGRTQLSLDRQTSGKTTKLVLTGTMATAANTKWIYRSLASPLDYAAVTFREIYGEMGGIVEGELHTKETPEDTQIISATLSPHTGFILGEMTKHSNNQMAEQMAVIAAQETYGRSSRVAVKRLLLDTLQAHGIDIDGAVLLNASGLSRKARMTSRQLVQTTAALRAHPQWSYEAMASLAIFGRDGTVKSRLRGTPAADRVRAKTGSMSGVAAIAGVAETSSNQSLAFALIVNDLPEKNQAKTIWNEMVDTMIQTCPADTAIP